MSVHLTSCLPNSFNKLQCVIITISVLSRDPSNQDYDMRFSDKKFIRFHCYNTLDYKIYY